MTQTKDRHMLRWGLTLEFLLSSVGAYAFILHNQAEGWWAVSSRLQAIGILMGAIAAGIAVLCAYAWLGDVDRLTGWFDSLAGKIARLRAVLIPVMLVLLVAFPLGVSGNFGPFFSSAFARLAVFSWLVILMIIAVRAYWNKPVLESAAIAALSMAVAHHLSTYIPHVSSYPFAQWWSETTRFYLGSTFFDQRIYGQDLPWVFRDLTRYLIQAVPFVFKGSPLWASRLWQAALRFLSGYLLGYAFSRRMKINKTLLAGMLTAWIGLFLFQGPLFYNLVPIVLLVIWLAESDKFWKTLLVVLAASIYAGLSRINWVPMAGLIASSLYFLEIPARSKKVGEILRYLISPAVWTITGSLLGIAVMQVWQGNSGNPPEIFHSSFSSDLIYSRLFPNPSYGPGIILATLAVSAPLLVYLLMGFRGWRERIHPIRLAGLAAILALMGGGGLVVSLKIGGGTNLHNMDVFLVILLVIAAELIFGRVVDEQDQAFEARMPDWLMAVVVIVPVGFVVLFFGRSIPPKDLPSAQADVAILQAYADEAVSQGEEVLFIAERHLLTFGLIEDVSLVHAHEKLLLQEMAMAYNFEYLESFAEEMEEQQYAVIVMDPLPKFWKDPEKVGLAAENNVVLKYLAPLITCAYEVETSLQDGALDVMVPKAEPTCNLEKE